MVFVCDLPASLFDVDLTFQEGLGLVHQDRDSQHVVPCQQKQTGCIQFVDGRNSLLFHSVVSVIYLFVLVNHEKINLVLVDWLLVHLDDNNQAYYHFLSNQIPLSVNNSEHSVSTITNSELLSLMTF